MTDRVIVPISPVRGQVYHDRVPFFDMQASRRRDEMVFCHSMDAEELKAHLERPIILGDCPLCEWFGKSSKEKM